jgi:hypothetical protein
MSAETTGGTTSSLVSGFVLLQTLDDGPNFATSDSGR